MKKIKNQFKMKKSQKTKDTALAVFYFIMGIITAVLYINVMFEIPLIFFGLAAGKMIRVYFKSKKTADEYYDKDFKDFVDDDFDWDYYESGQADMDTKAKDYER